MNISKLIHNKVVNGELSNVQLIELINQCGSYLNLKNIPDYAKDNNMSYNGVKRFRNIVEIFNTKYVIDND